MMDATTPIERFTRERTMLYSRVIFTAVVVGAAVGAIVAGALGVGVQYLGPLEGYRLGGLVGAFVGSVFGGTSGLGLRGVIGGAILGALVGAGIGNAAWNAQLAEAPHRKFDEIITFPALSFEKTVVIGLLTGAAVGGIGGAIPAMRRSAAQRSGRAARGGALRL